MKNCYTQLIDLKLAEIRLETLEEIKKKLLTKVTSCTSQLKETTSSGGFADDKLDQYLIKLEEIDEEIDLKKAEISILNKGINEMKAVVKELKDIETQVFSLHFFEGHKPTEVAQLIPCDLSTVYRKIEIINKKYEDCKKMRKLS